MSELSDHYIFLQVLVSTFSLLSAICQIFALQSFSCYKSFQLTMISLSILSSIFYIIAIGLSDTQGILHFIVLVLALCTGSLQIVILGLVTRKKKISRNIFIELALVWSTQYILYLIILIESVNLFILLLFHFWL